MTSITFYRCPSPPAEAGEPELPVRGFFLFHDIIQGDQEGLSGARVEEFFRNCGSEWVLWCHHPGSCSLEGRDLERMLELGAGASWVFGECLDGPAGTRRILADYQPGSLRDDFDFGPFSLIRTAAARAALERTGGLLPTRWAGLYDLRLRMAETELPLRLPEPLARVDEPDQRPSGERQFDYLDRARTDYQEEMELVCRSHLERIGAALPPVTGRFDYDVTEKGWPHLASVVIPVRDRVATIGAALESALSQETVYDYNILVVDNHSTDGTGELVDEFAAGDDRVVRIVPSRTGLGIGGCLNEAARSPRCGRIMVQLDSDDLYANRQAVNTIIETMLKGSFAMLVGSYRLVNQELRELPPGVIDHREWTRENGPNNLLRLAGIGAPRAIATRLVTSHPYGDVSYGEDYGMALRISREYEVGRIWDPIYLCRRWPGNSDADLDPSLVAAHHTYKDRLRTLEIQVRKGLLQGG